MILTNTFNFVFSRFFYLNLYTQKGTAAKIIAVPFLRASLISQALIY
ncbi:hypothetical protein Lpp225_1953 [Lacticaseibacillus paracasei subsp. paracasei Lpp225]|uniref:Uncharacterized protein n=1 Tax=Lacticaseibacillus paracasei subsp. paracasei Lpp225 TaxID=1256225 RepID=S2N8P7_LACPA|nr:hypothetical protein LCA211_0319 [Lacticaseibacillus casei 21/1]EPC37149.1 hypothetical protein Lpp225_1953 [Lacticaseibacillus paracasei subsp. paracasei Lpp225]